MMKSLLVLPIAFLLFACAQNKTAMTEADTEPQSLVVLLQKDADPLQVLSSYDQIDLRSIQLISRSKNEIRCSLMSSSVDTTRLLSALGSDPNVIRANLWSESADDPMVTTGQNMDFSQTAPNQMVAVTLKPGIDPEEILSKYEEIHAKSIKRISRSENKVSCLIKLTKEDLKEWMNMLLEEDSISQVELFSDNPDAPSSGTNDGFSKTKPIRD